MSRQIAAIEDEIGAKLFSRCNNVLSLTKAGRVLLHQLSGLYSDYQNVIKNVRDVAAGIEGHINIGVFGGSIYGRLPVRRHPPPHSKQSPV